MTTPDTLELRRKAEAATPGRWYHETDHYNDHGGRYDQISSPVEIVSGEWGGPTGANAAFIAAANPAVILALLDRLDALEGRAQAAEDKAEGLSADLRMAVQVAYRRGATEWARLNYPSWIDWLEACEEEAPNTIADEGRDQ